MLKDHGLEVFRCHCYDDRELEPHADCCLYHCPTMARFDTSYLHSVSKTVADTAVLHVRQGRPG